VLLFMSLQVVATVVGRFIAYSLLGAATLLCWPFPSFIGKHLLVALAAPAGLVELVTFVIYVSLFVIKAMIARVGARWHPNDWGSFGQDYVAFVLGVVADMWGIKLNGFLILVFIFIASHLSGIVLGQSLGYTLVWATFGREWAESLALTDTGLTAVYPVLNDTLPTWVGFLVIWLQLMLISSALGQTALYPVLNDTLPTCVGFLVNWLHLPIAVMSLTLNIMAHLLLLKRSFIDRHPVAIEILPAQD